ncbi:MAG TPA: hypothetical protein VMH28_23560 [Candidatus Acidoferrales bacterium]|nr:hypothetical protein [Candidatus Acidoferrales bacterium]
MDQPIDDLMVEIDDARHALDRDLQRLETRVKREARWLVRFQQHPWLFAAGLCGGVLLFAYLVEKLRQ